MKYFDKAHLLWRRSQFSRKVLFTFLLGTSSLAAFAQFPDPYCEVAFGSNEEPITLVQFAGIDNTSDAATGGTAHEDFTALAPGEVSAGLSYPITLNGNSDGDYTNYFWVYADWNQDGDFTDPGETYAAGSIDDHDGETDDPSTYAVTQILVPPTAMGGTTRLRVLKKFSSPADPGSCNTAGYGQAEDYTLNVTAASCTPPSATFTTTLDCAADEFSVDVAVTSLGSATSLALTDGTTTFEASITTTGTYVAGPFDFGATVTLTLIHNLDAICSINSGSLSEAGCPPANDECDNAIALTVNPDLNCGIVTSGTVQSATASADAVTCTGTEDDDVWYSFTATATEHQVSLSNISGSVTDMAMELLDGCGGANLACSDPNTFLATGLTVGNTYMLRVYTYTSTGGQNTTFDVCIGTPPPPPANDECDNAIALTVNPDLNCGVVTSGTVQSATASADAVTCTGTEDDDVWYSFTATATEHQVSLSNISGSVTDMAMELLDGCGGANLACSDPNSFMATGLTIGNAYLLRVYTYTSTGGQTTTFDVCIGTFPPPPANDEASGAIALTVNADYNCGTITAGTTASATESADAAPGCSASGVNDDVWYSFIATNALHRITVSGTTSNTVALALYEGAVGSLTPVAGACASTTLDATGLIVGNTYYVRAYTTSSTASTYSNFSICVGTPPPPPPNDECENAVDISGGAVINGTTYSATPTITEPECGSVTSNEVWYSVTTIEDGELTIDVINTSGDMVVAVYTGSCGVLTNVACEDGPAIGTETVVIPATVSGTTYLIRVFGFEGEEGNFTIEASGIPLPVQMDVLKGHLDKDNSAVLTWTTFKEVNNNGFDIQRSENGKDFRNIAFIPTKADGGNSTEAIAYQYIDQQKGEGEVFYRLVQQDRDGRTKVSNVVRLTAAGKAAFVVQAYPNPASDKLNITIEGMRAANSQVTVMDVLGKVILNLPVSSGQVTIDMHGLPSGRYLVTYTDDVHHQVIKVSKQ